ncbi:SEL1-like repeat protein [Wohlfahrtiimonas chitiniclastica]|uniref:SEL1-like repeat protein n=1 Tax=Wohlfahrtiimonas chitiniclastica TaxID=400946 RepID=UPI001BCF8FBD|nr:hypothetical protein [Wohlfahrtiimonas chitiniclastica]MBS7837064.1 sel1 repeat family protein [Wohlfahrtiimonas chitiniclastica]
MIRSMTQYAALCSLLSVPYTTLNLAVADHGSVPTLLHASSLAISALILEDASMEKTLRRADNGHLKSMLKAARIYHFGDFDQDIESDIMMAQYWYERAITEHPKDYRAYYELAELLRISSPNDPNLLSYYQKATQLTDTDIDVLLFAARFFAERGLDQQALTQYERVIALKTSESSTYYAKLSSAHLLKYGGQGVQKNPRKAHQYYLEIVANNFNDAESFYELGDDYQHGIGTAVDLTQAKDYYQRSFDGRARLPLGQLLLQSTDEAQRAEGVEQVIAAMALPENRQAVTDILLPLRTEYPKIAAWLYDQAVYSDHRNGFDARAVLKEGCEANDPDHCFYEALWQLGNRVYEKEGFARMLAFATANDERAMAKLIEHYHDQNDAHNELKWLKARAELLQTEEAYEAVAYFYVNEMDYDEAVIWYGKIDAPSEDIARNFQHAKNEAAYFKQRAIAAKTDWEDTEFMASIYQRQGRFDQAIALLEPWAQTKETAGHLWMDALDRSQTPENLQRATQHHLKRAKAGEEAAYYELYQRYVQNIDPTIMREDVVAWMQDWQALDADQSRYYIEELEAYDEALKQQDLETLAKAYQFGSGIRKDEAKYWALLEELSAQNNQWALQTLAYAYYYGEIEPHDWSKAVALYQKLNEPDEEATAIMADYERYFVPAEQGDDAAKAALGRYYVTTEPFKSRPDDVKKGLALLNQAAAAGNGDAMLSLADYYGYEDYAPYLQLKWLEAAVDAGNHEAALKLAQLKIMRMMYPLVNEAEQTGIEDLLTFAAQKLEAANEALVDFYLLMHQDERAEALLDTLPLATQQSLYPKLGEFHATDTDEHASHFNKAARYYDKAYQGGDLIYGIKLAELYWQGDQTLARDEQQATALMNAVFSAIIDSQALYLSDNIVESLLRLHREDAFARAWLKRLSIEGHSYAAAQLAQMYAKEEDYASAYLYAKVAGHWFADDLASHLTPAVIEALDARAQQLAKAKAPSEF